MINIALYQFSGTCMSYILRTKIFQTLRISVAALFFLSTLTPVSLLAQEPFMPAPGSLVYTSVPYAPPMLKGIIVDPQAPLAFDFILDVGDGGKDSQKLKTEGEKLIKYFLASLTIPEEDLWVNLSPYEEDEIIPDSLARTDLGRDLLAQDYLLKQLSASLTYPEDEIGEAFWKKVYQRAREKYGTSQIPVSTFNKVWIIPDQARIYEYQNRAIIVYSHLKVLTEDDYSNYWEFRKNQGQATKEADESKETIDLSTEVLKEIIIPEIEHEVNFGRNFAALRQIYHSYILAAWYKRKIRESLLGQKYIDQKKIKGLETTHQNAREEIFQNYMRAFEKGVYDYIRRDYDPVEKKMLPRKYFSGGVELPREDSIAIIQPDDITANAMQIMGQDRSFISAQETDVLAQAMTVLANQESIDQDRLVRMKGVLSSSSEDSLKDYINSLSSAAFATAFQNILSSDELRIANPKRYDLLIAKGLTPQTMRIQTMGALAVTEEIQRQYTQLDQDLGGLHDGELSESTVDDILSSQLLEEMLSNEEIFPDDTSEENGEETEYIPTDEEESIRAIRNDPNRWKFPRAFQSIPPHILKGKTVFIRVDYNVKYDLEGNVMEDSRIAATVKFIAWCMRRGLKIIIASHLDDVNKRVKEDLTEMASSVAGDFSNEEAFFQEYGEIADRLRRQYIQKFNMEYAAARLKELLDQELGYDTGVYFNPNWGSTRKARPFIKNSMKPGEVIVLQNTRFDDREMALHKAKTKLSDAISKDILKNKRRKKWLDKNLGPQLIEKIERLQRQLMADQHLSKEKIDAIRSDFIRILIDEDVRKNLAMEFNQPIKEISVKTMDAFMDQVTSSSLMQSRIFHIFTEIDQAIKKIYPALKDHLEFQHELTDDADFYVAEHISAFHRGHASTTAGSWTQAYVGPLAMEEIHHLVKILSRLDTAVIGGKNVKALDEKLLKLLPGLIDNAPLLRRILTGGTVGQTFVKALYELEKEEKAKDGKPPERFLVAKNLWLKVPQKELDPRKNEKKYIDFAKKIMRKMLVQIIRELEQKYPDAPELKSLLSQERDEETKERVALISDLLDTQNLIALQNKYDLKTPIIIAPLGLRFARRMRNPKYIETIEVSVDEEIEDGWNGFGLSLDTMDLHKQVLRESMAAFWNGPMEVNRRNRSDRFAYFVNKIHYLGRDGSKNIAETMHEEKDKVINGVKKIMVAGGGGTVETVKWYGDEDYLSYLFKGGGSSLTFFSGGLWPAYLSLIQNNVPQTFDDFLRIETLIESGGLIEEAMYAHVVHHAFQNLFEELKEVMQGFDKELKTEFTDKKLAELRWFYDQLKDIKDPMPLGQEVFIEGKDEKIAEEFLHKIKNAFQSRNFRRIFESSIVRAGEYKEKIDRYMQQVDEKKLDAINTWIRQIKKVRHDIWQVYRQFAEGSILKYDFNLPQAVKEEIEKLWVKDYPEDDIPEIMKSGIVDIDFNVEGNIPSFVTDDARFRRAFTLILRNAIRAAVARDASGQYLSIDEIIGNQEGTKSRIQVRLTYDGTNIQLSVIDNGIGMTSEKVDRVRRHYVTEDYEIKTEIEHQAQVYQVGFGRRGGGGIAAWEQIISEMMGVVEISSLPYRGTEVKAIFAPIKKRDIKELNLSPEAVENTAQSILKSKRPPREESFDRILIRSRAPALIKEGLSRVWDIAVSSKSLTEEQGSKFHQILEEIMTGYNDLRPQRIKELITILEDMGRSLDDLLDEEQFVYGFILSEITNIVTAKDWLIEHHQPSKGLSRKDIEKKNTTFNKMVENFSYQGINHITKAVTVNKFYVDPGRSRGWFASYVKSHQDRSLLERLAAGSALSEQIQSFAGRPSRASIEAQQAGVEMWTIAERWGLIARSTRETKNEGPADTTAGGDLIGRLYDQKGNPVTEIRPKVELIDGQFTIALLDSNMNPLYDKNGEQIKPLVAGTEKVQQETKAALVQGLRNAFERKDERMQPEERAIAIGAIEFVRKQDIFVLPQNAQGKYPVGGFPLFDQEIGGLYIAKNILNIVTVFHEAVEGFLNSREGHKLRQWVEDQGLTPHTLARGAGKKERVSGADYRRGLQDMLFGELVNNRVSLEIQNLFEETLTAEKEQAIAPSHSPEETGGIDLRPENLDLKTEGTGFDFEVDFSSQELKQIDIPGLIPVIYSITPITNLPQLLGLETGDSPENKIHVSLAK